ncbi:surfeit locus protein 6 homolog, partial [Agrilus planipennis]|uniref:Surfeit locus protein 6 homolog n=1 Tax=Agrilus planipennis TaxID=224129 RepID=A0A1W4WJ41_AGRPL
MQLTKSPKFDSKRAREILLKEDKFITHLFSILPVPVSRREHDSKTDEEEYLLPSNKPHQLVSYGGNEKPSRASSLLELQKRLEAVKAKRLTVKQKIDKKKLKNKIKKNEKKNERNAKKKLAKAVKSTTSGNLDNQKEENEISQNTSEVTQTQPVFNKDASMVFSKIDFSEVGKKNKKKQKVEKDPKMILKKLETQKEKIKELEEKGEVEKAIITKQKEAWKSALAKAEGKKVKDDPLLLKKTVKKQEQIKRKSAKQWEQRKEKLEKVKEERQKKRQENIKKKKDKKKADKMKKAAKKGK